MSAPGGRLLHWHSDAMATMELISSFADFTETWFKSVTICIAALWLVFRVYSVVGKPSDELVSLLGLEVPAQPEISLAGVKADGILLHWKPPESHSTVTKHHVHVNGINIGEVSARDSSVTVHNLKPDHSYTVRVVALNSNFSAASDPIRFTTKPASSDDFLDLPKEENDADPSDETNEPSPPMLRPCKTLFEPVKQQLPTPPPPMAREHSNSLSQKRSPQPRRISSIVISTDESGAQSSETSDTEDAMRDLTNKLETLRRENEEAERQEREELDEYESMRSALTEERDRYKLQLKEKDDTSRDLKKEVTRLERTNTAVQGSKNTAERKLQSKHNERKKMKDDIARWDREVEEMKTAVENLIEQKEALGKETEAKLDEFREQLAKEHAANKTLEEDIKEKNTQIKGLEQEKRNMSDGEIDTAPQGLDGADDDTRRFEEKLHSLQMRYTMAWNASQQAEAVYTQAQQHLDRLQARRMSSPQLFASTPTLEPAPIRRTSNRRRRAGSIRSDLNSPASTGFAAVSAPPFNNSISSISPTFSSGSPFFNINNGMTLEPARPISLTQAQIDALTGGAPMSPSTAGALLPSNLLADDADQSASDFEGERKDADIPRTNSHGRRPHSLNGDSASLNQSNRNSTALPGLGAIPGLGAAPILDLGAQAPSSPVSVDSRSPSLFASPKESSLHLPHPDSFNESDRRSIRSNTGSSRGVSGTSRFFGGLNLRHRGKTSTDEGPPLGSLKSSQSQSLPRQDPPQDPIGTRRRGSHSGGSGWMPSISQAFSRNAGSGKDAEETAQSSAEPTKPSRLRPFGMFAKAGEPWLASSLLNRSASSRSPSTHSIENQFPRPSTGNEHRFGWPAEALGQRTSPLGPDWGLAAPNSWSRHPSRRPSIQYGPSAALAPDVAMLDPNSIDQPPRRSPTQAPIGTRPQTSQGQGSTTSTAPPTPPRLNPAAPSFNLFKRNKKTDEADKSPEKEKTKDKKGKEKEKESISPTTQSPNPDTPRADAFGKDSSPPESRISKDTRSISTANESLDFAFPRDSLEQTQSRTPSESQPGHMTPVSTKDSGKETFMQKLSRKTSATGSKLKTPFGKDSRGSLFGGARKGTPMSGANESIGTPDETDEDVGVLSRSVESVQIGSASGSPLVGAITDESARSAGTGKDNRSSGRSWGSLRLTRKKDKEEKERAPSMDDSMASETGDEEDWAEVHAPVV